MKISRCAATVSLRRRGKSDTAVKSLEQEHGRRLSPSFRSREEGIFIEMAVLAEVLPLHGSSEWLLAEEAFAHIEQEARLETFQFMGSIALRGAETTIPQETERLNDSTLLYAIEEAAKGDEQSREVVRTCVATDVAERLFKVANITRVELQLMDEKITQQGRHLVDIHRNTLEHTILNEVMLWRTRTETKNAFTFEGLWTSGILETHDALVFEPAPTDQATRRDYNFFTDTDTMSAQLLSADGDSAVLETALVAGKRHATAERHDVEAVVSMAASHGIEISIDQPDELVGKIFLVPKESIPNGISDIVEGLDQPLGTFFGQDVPAQDYQTYAEQCQQRNASFDSMVEEITVQLLQEAPQLKSPLDAIKRLDKLSEEKCVVRAIDDHQINTAIFGEVAARHIEDARFFQERGDMQRAAESVQLAQKTAKSSSCPLFGKNGESASPDSSGDGESQEKSKKKWMSCPHCKAKVYDDPCANILSCGDCRALVIGGKVISKGNSYRKRAEAEKKKQAQAKLAREQFALAA